MPDIEKMEQIFFEAMKAGWATKVEKTTIPRMPGYKAIVWEDGLWRVVDSYAVGPDITLGGNRSAGSTTIFYEDKPVWVMQYGGYYHKKAIPFLKQALLNAYCDRKFFGGRGPSIYKEGNWIYINHTTGVSFEGFKGREEIINMAEDCFYGWHEYWGLSLLA